MYQHSIFFFSLSFSYLESHIRLQHLFILSAGLRVTNIEYSLVIVATCVGTIITTIVFGSGFLFLGRSVGSGQAFHVVHLGHVLITAHIDIEKVALAKHVHAELEQEVLGHASLHLHAIIWSHVHVSHIVGVAGCVLAELHCLAHSSGKCTLLHDLLETILLCLHLY